MASQRTGAQSLLDIAVGKEDGSPSIVKWPQLGQTFLFRLDGAYSNPAMTTEYEYPRRLLLRNAFVDFRVGGYIVASRRIRDQTGSISLTQEEMLAYWTVASYNSVEVNEGIDYSRIEVWLPVGQSMVIFGDYWKWIPG